MILWSIYYHLQSFLILKKYLSFHETYSFDLAAILQKGSMNLRFWSAVSCLIRKKKKCEHRKCCMCTLEFLEYWCLCRNWCWGIFFNSLSEYYLIPTGTGIQALLLPLLPLTSRYSLEVLSKHWLPCRLYSAECRNTTKLLSLDNEPWGRESLNNFVYFPKGL